MSNMNTRKREYMSPLKIVGMVFVLGLLLIFGTVQYTKEWSETTKITYQIVGKTEGSTSGKSPRLQWVFALKDTDGDYIDKDVSFSTFTRFNVGDRVPFDGYKNKEMGQKRINYIGLSFLLASGMWISALGWLLAKEFE